MLPVGPRSSSTASRWGTLATMPRKPLLSGTVAVWFIFFKPNWRTITFCFSGRPIGLATSLIVIVPCDMT
jgi:hypothetical protein